VLRRPIGPEIRSVANYLAALAAPSRTGPLAAGTHSPARAHFRRDREDGIMANVTKNERRHVCGAF
jgi:hypothetical protein